MQGLHKYRPGREGRPSFGVQASVCTHHSVHAPVPRRFRLRWPLLLWCQPGEGLRGAGGWLAEGLLVHLPPSFATAPQDTWERSLSRRKRFSCASRTPSGPGRIRSRYNDPVLAVAGCRAPPWLSNSSQSCFLRGASPGRRRRGGCSSAGRPLAPRGPSSVARDSERTNARPTTDTHARASAPAEARAPLNRRPTDHRRTPTHATTRSPHTHTTWLCI